MRLIFPPGGAYAASGQSLANQLLYRQLSGPVPRGGGRRRRKARPLERAQRRRAAKVARPARLVKGSAAAKAYMASIRRKRKR